MARSCRVLIVFDTPLFAAGLKSLLDAEEGMEVRSCDAAAFKGAQTLSTFRPDVLIAEDNLSLSREHSEYAYHNVPTVIRLSLHNRSMRVCRWQQIRSAGTRDLLRAIRSRRPQIPGRDKRQVGGSDEAWLGVDLGKAQTDIAAHVAGGGGLSDAPGNGLRGRPGAAGNGGARWSGGAGWGSG